MWRLTTESVADFFDGQVDDGRQPEQFARVWVHTHPGDSSQPSQVDEETFTRVFGRSDWALMFILACGGQTFARLQFNVGPRAVIEIPVGIDYSRSFGHCDREAWEQEYLANVRPQQLPLFGSHQTNAVSASPFDEELSDEWLDSWHDYVDGDSQGDGQFETKGFAL